MDARLPQPLDCSNLAKEWPMWKQQFFIYMLANNKNNEPEPNKIATLLWLIGKRGMEIYNSLFPYNGNLENMFDVATATIAASTSTAGGNVNVSVNAGSATTTNNTADANAVGNNSAAVTDRIDNYGVQRTLAQVITAFDEYCLPRKNLAVEAFKFNMIVQREKQSFSEFETELRTQLQYCEFSCASCHSSYADRILRDHIIVGIQDKKLQLRLLDGNDEPLSKIIQICKTFETAAENKQLLDTKTLKTEVNTVDAKSAEDSKSGDEVAVIRAATCFNCGQQFNERHRRNCPANNVSCHSCGRRGHFAKFCKSKQNDVKGKKSADGKRPENNNSRQNTVYRVNYSDLGNSDYCKIRSFRISPVENNNCYCRVDANTVDLGHNRWTKRYLIQNLPIEFKLDTGADINCIPMNFIRRINVPFSRIDNIKVTDYNSNRINIHGEVRLTCFDEEKGIGHVARFLVVDEFFEPLLGLDACVSFDLIKRVNAVGVTSVFPSEVGEFVERERDIFDGVGKFPGTCSIVLRDGSTPVLHYRKRIPMTLHDRLREELMKLEKGGIISSVDYPTDWVNNIQIVEKPNGSLRVCLDPRPLNKCIKREHFLIPKSEDILSRLSGKRVFTVLDLRNGFWQVELDRQSSDLTTFMTPFGRYRWNRLPFGINNAPEMFQRRMVQIFGDIPGVEIYFDDMSVSGIDHEDHDRKLRLVLERARENGIKFNPDKIQYRTGEVKFMGHIISNDCVKPDRCYIEAIVNMPTPQNKGDILRLLGLYKFLGKFIPNLSKRTAGLRELSRNDVEWSWSDRHDLEVKELSESITSAPVLALYDPGQPVLIQTDASKDGLGSVLLQNDMPVAYASRTLSKNEQKWAQIEKELLAIVFACERFHYFLYGREFIVHSDHKPLEPLMKRDIDDVTPRLRRMFMYLLKYPGMSIVYRPGKQILVADCLSRAPLPEIADMSGELSGMIHSLSGEICMSPDNIEGYRDFMRADERFSRIVKYVESGWPPYHQLDDFSQLFHKYKAELHYENGLLLKDHRLVIPTNMQSDICRMLHESHLGIEKTLARARTQFFWPGMTNDLTEVVKSCVICEKFTRNNRKEPLVQDDAPEYPFHRVSTDIYEYAGYSYIVLIDAYSGFICSERLVEKTARQCISTLDGIFCKYGYPTRMRCDNNPFNSREFDLYANEFNIELVFSSPRYPQSNGLAEKGVAIAKGILKRCFEADIGRFQYNLLEYNVTPVAGMGVSPAQLFFGRQLKTRLPISRELLVRNTMNERIVRGKLENRKSVQKKYYDRNAKQLSVLNPGDRIMFRKNSKEWQYGKILRKFNDRSYIVVDSFDNHFRRNRRFITTTRNNDYDSSDMLYEDNIANFRDNIGRSGVNLQTRNIPCDDDNSDLGPRSEKTDQSAGESSDSSVYHEADSDSYGSASDPDDCNTHENSENVGPLPTPLTVCSPYRTRSGRTVRPPKMYMFDSE